MKSSLRSFIRKTHLWLGISSGLFVFIMAISGCVYVFKEEIEHLFNLNIKLEEQKLSDTPSLSELVNTAKNCFNNKYKFGNIGIPNSTDSPISISFIEFNKEAFGYPNSIEFYKTVYLNPYSGKIIQVENSKWAFFNVVLNIHMNLFMGFNTISHVLVITSVCAFILSLIGGIYLWWPKKTSKKALKKSFLFSWKTHTKWKRKNFDLHKILGFYVCLFALVLALTGLFWASINFKNMVKWVANGGETITEKELPAPILEATELPLDKIYSTIKKQYPDAFYYLIRQHPKPSIPYIVRVYTSKTKNYLRIEMYYDKESGELLHKEMFQDKSNGDKVQALNYDIHVGSIFGLPGKILAFLCSLIIASLPVSGLILWLGKKNTLKE